MARTEIDGDQILDGTIQKKDIDTTTSGQALITSFAVSGSGFDLTESGVDPGTGDITLSLAAGGFGGDFYSSFDATESTTTSNNWITKIQDTTDPVTGDGKYILIFTIEAGQNTKFKPIGTRIRYRINGGAWVLVTDIRDGVSTADQFQLRTGFTIVTGILTGDIIEVQIQYGQTDDGGTGKVKNAGFISWRVE